jgi:hypothetical protein
LPRRGPTTGRFGSSWIWATGPWSKPTSFTRSSSAISAVWLAAAPAPRTYTRRSGWRSFTPASPRALRPTCTTRRTAAISSSTARSSSSSRRCGQPARKTDSGAPSHGSKTSDCQRYSVMNGMIGAITRSACTSAVHSTRKAASSSV